MSIESEITRLNDAKADIAAAIEEYGVSVAEDATLDEYGSLVRSITIPTALPNPFALTFTGAAEGSYDGSQSVNINIPLGSDGVPVGAIKLWEGTWTSGEIQVVADSSVAGCTGLGNISDYSMLYVISAGAYPYLVFRSSKDLYGGCVTWSSTQSLVVCRCFAAHRYSSDINTFTYEAHKYFKSGGSDTTVSTGITAIYGIPLGEEAENA